MCELKLTLEHKADCALFNQRGTSSATPSCTCGYENNLAYVKYLHMRIKALEARTPDPTLLECVKALENALNHIEYADHNLSDYTESEVKGIIDTTCPEKSLTIGVYLLQQALSNAQQYLTKE